MSFDFSILKRNLGLKILSIVLAIFTWAYVKYTQAPYASMFTDIKVKVPLVLENKDDKYVALDVPEEVIVTAKGSAEVLPHLASRHFKAYIDLKDKKVGQHHLRIKVNAPPGVESVDITPEYALIRLDPEEKRLFNVKVKPQGAIATGFLLGVPSPKPESVTVKGAQSIVSKVKEVQAVCDVEGADMDRIQQVEVEAVDEEGKIVESVSVEPKYVRVTIHVKSEVTNANVPISANLEGAPAKGFRIKEVTIKPMIATIRYPYNMQSPPQVIQTQPMSIQGATGDLEKEVTFIVPKDVILVYPEKARITVKIAKDKAPPASRMP